MTMTRPRPRARRKPAGVRRARRVLGPGLEQLRAISHPLRLRLFELFSEHPRTTMQAAERLGLPPTRLYHHVTALERAGLVRLRETRRHRGATEKYFEAVARRLEPRPRSRGRGSVMGPSELSAVALVVFDQARSELLRVMGSAGQARPAALMAVRAVLRMSPARALQLQKKLIGVLRRTRRANVRKGARRSPPGPRLRRYSVTVALLPLDEPGVES
jgi:DNA-binding transcriptional ArsR family regulator